MGGPSNTSAGGHAPRRPSEAGGSGSGGGLGSGSRGSDAYRTGEGGGAADGGSGCPEELLATTHGPSQGLLVGTLLTVTLDPSTTPSRVVMVDPVSMRTVGAIGGVPNLARLVECLAAGVAYGAAVTFVEGGRIDLRIVRQSA